MPAGDVVQQVWWSQWALPVHMWEAKAVTIDFFPGRLKDSCWHNGARVILRVSVSKQSHQEACNPSWRFTVNFLTNFLPQFSASKLPYPGEQRVLSACSVAMPFRTPQVPCSPLEPSCFLVQTVLHLQQKLQCKGLSIGWGFRNTTH